MSFSVPDAYKKSKNKIGINSASGFGLGTLSHSKVINDTKELCVYFIIVSLLLSHCYLALTIAHRRDIT